jgi:hypothetical protein
LNSLDLYARWQLLVHNAKKPFKTREELLVAARNVVDTFLTRREKEHVEERYTGASSSGSSSDSRDSK